MFSKLANSALTASRSNSDNSASVLVSSEVLLLRLVLGKFLINSAIKLSS